MNTLDAVGRVLSIVGVLFVLLVFWKRERFKKFLLARAGKRTFTRKQFWTSLAVGAVVFSLLPSFFQSCTGFHLPPARAVIMSLGGFVMFAVLSALMCFVLDKKYRALRPETSVHVGFILVAVSGGFFVLALWFYYLGHA